jgi:hypothetical protein
LLCLEPEIDTRDRNEELGSEAIGCDLPCVGRSPPDALVADAPVAKTMMAVLVRKRESLADYGLPRVDEDERHVALTRVRTRESTLRQLRENDIDSIADLDALKKVGDGPVGAE